MGDFIGFTFNGTHSSDLGITRVSGGDRYEEQLYPEIKDSTAEIPGINGMYYFGSNYGAKTIDLEIAFDNITEIQLREIRQIFGTKKVKELIFDERPYKKYLAKIENPIELSYVCFDEPIRTVGAEKDGIRIINRTIEPVDTVNTSREELTATVILDTFQTQFPDDGEYEFIYDGENDIWLYNNEEIDLALCGIEYEGELINEDVITVSVITTITAVEREKITPYEIDYAHERRIYKGEGKISFICPFPFAKSIFKKLPENSDEWAESSKILTSEEYAAFDTYDNVTGEIKVYNAGDLDAGFKLYLPGSVLGSNTSIIYKKDGDAETASLLLNAMTLKGSDIGVMVDTNNSLIVGITEFERNQNESIIYKTSTNIYNEYVDSGYFFHLEPNDKYDDSILQIIGGGNGIEIFYDYLYF